MEIEPMISWSLVSIAFMFNAIWDDPSWVLSGQTLDSCGSVIVGLCYVDIVWFISCRNSKWYWQCQNIYFVSVEQSSTSNSDQWNLHCWCVFICFLFDERHDVIGIPATPMCQGDFRRRRQDSPPPIPEAIGDRDLSAKWVVVDGYPLVNWHSYWK